MDKLQKWFKAFYVIFIEYTKSVLVVNFYQGKMLTQIHDKLCKIVCADYVNFVAEMSIILYVF